MPSAPPPPKTTFDSYKPTTFDEVWKMCGAASASSFFKSIQKTADAFVLYTWAQEHGVPVSEAWANCFEINGAVVVGIHLQTAMILRRPELVEAYEIRESTERSATFYGRRRGGQDHEVRFTWEDAQKAKLATKDNYTRHPRDMLLKMAKVRVHRALWADILGGAVYDADEMSSGLAPAPMSPEEIAALNSKMGAPAAPDGDLVVPPGLGGRPEPTDGEHENMGAAPDLGPDGDTSDASDSGGASSPTPQESPPSSAEPAHDPKTGEIDPDAPASQPQKDEIRKLLRESGVWAEGVHWRTAWKTVDEIIGSHVPPGKITVDLADMVIVTLRGKLAEDAPPDELFDDIPPPEPEDQPPGPKPTVAKRIKNGNGPDVFWARAVRAATDGDTLEKLVSENHEQWLESFDPDAMGRIVEEIKKRALELDRPDLAKAFKASP